MNLTIGTRLSHPVFGEGVVMNVTVQNYKIYFGPGRTKEIARSFENFEILEAGPENSAAASSSISLSDIERALNNVLTRMTDFSQVVPLGDRWSHGKMVLVPGTAGTASKEIPLESFFHKIVMVRDRLRVLEQNINSSDNLSDEEKIHMQQYITRCYGSLTTFNVLFKNKEHHFVGDRKED